MLNCVILSSEYASVHNAIRLDPLNMDSAQITIRPLKLGSGQAHILITILYNLAAMQSERYMKKERNLGSKCRVSSSYT